MDPASAIGLVGAIVGIADVIVKSVDSLRHFQASYQGADFRIGALVSQLLAVKAALGNVSDMISDSGHRITQGGTFSRQFCEDLRVSLYGCEAMVCALDSQLVNVRRNEHNGLSAASRFHVALQDSTIDGYVAMLNHQTSALQLLLTSLQCRTAMGGSSMLHQTAARQIIKQVRDDTSSLLWLYDEESLLSMRSTSTQQDLSTISTEFSFDSDLITSKVYRSAMRSHMIFAIGSGGDSVRSRRSAAPRSAFRMSTRFSIRSSRLSIAEEEEESDDGDTIKEAKADAASVFSKSSSRRRLVPSLLPPSSIQVRGGRDLNDTLSLRSNIRSVYTGDEALSRFWHQRSQPNQSVLSRVIQGVAPLFAPKNATNVLLLGLAGTGKSTLVKSLLYVFGCMDVRTRQSYIEDIHREAVESMRTVVQRGQVGLSFDSELEFAYRTLQWSNTDVIDEAMANACSTFWKEPAFRQKVVDRRSEREMYMLPESAEHLFDSVHRLAMPNYIPSASDILRSYQKTIGFTVSNFEVKGRSYNFLDTPGLPVEGSLSFSKWQVNMHNTDILIFTFDIVVDREVIRPYATSTEDEERSAIHAAILGQQQSLEAALENPRLSDAKFIVLFTKVDRLTPGVLRRLGGTPLFTDYAGPNTGDAMLDHLARRLASGLGKRANKISFWRTSIANSSTEMAEIVLNAIEQLDESIDEEEATASLGAKILPFNGQH